MRVPRISLGKLFNVLQSPIGRMASWPMRNIKTFPSKQMYLYLSLVERKEAEFYHNIDRRRYLVWVRWLIFIAFPLLYYQKENNFFCNNVLLKTCKCVTFWIERVQTIAVLNSEDTKKWQQKQICHLLYVENLEFLQSTFSTTHATSMST